MNPREHDTQSTGPEPDTLTEPQVAELEHALSALPLAEPSAMLDHRVAATLRAAEATPVNGAQVVASDAGPYALHHPAKSHWLTGLAVAAVLALLAALGLTLYMQGGAPTQGPGEIAEEAPNTPTNPPPDTLAENNNTPDPAIVPAGYSFQAEPVKLHWTRDIDEGLLASESGTQPVRAIRRQDVQQEVWVDPVRGVTVQITRPRERLVVVKQPTF